MAHRSSIRGSSRYHSVIRHLPMPTLIPLASWRISAQHRRCQCDSFSIQGFPRLIRSLLLMEIDLAEQRWRQGND
ncbi:hypothetical protein GYMLUDRAFT_341617 [Collybiopsis luxurians FD-317 M1]|nr:hypothetical protein GYMLUDRAFT_341617 [Collybiopsis luxurians FD-317 M1]